MTTDIAKLGFDVDSRPIIKADDDLQDFAQSAQRAGDEVQDLGMRAKATGSQVKAMSATASMASGRMGGLSRNAGQAGIQIQQLVGQIQGGQSAFVALSQQGADLGIVLGAPLVGVIVSLGAVLAGALIPQLFGAKEEAKETAIEFDFLSDKLSDLTEQQKTFAAFSLSDQLLESQKRSNDLKAEIDALTNTLSVSSATLAQYVQEGKISAEQAAESSVFYTEQAKELAKLNFQLDAEAENIKNINDRLLILNGQKEETLSRNGRQPWWGGDEAVEREAFQIRMAIFQEEQAAIDEARMQNLAGYQSILQMQFQSTQAYLAQETEAEREVQRERLRGWQEYYSFRADSEIEESKRAKKAEKQFEKDRLETSRNLSAAYRTFMESENKALFRLGQAGAIGEALNNADVAATKALATLGPIAGPAAAGLMYGAGIARAASIAGRKFGDTGGGSAPSIPQAPAPVAGDTVQNTQTTINIAGNASQDIVDQLKELFGNDNIVIPRGSAQARELRS